MKQIFLPLCFIFWINSFAQITPDKVKQVLTGVLSIQSPSLHNEKLVTSFYELNNYHLVWMTNEGWELRKNLLKILSSAQDYGLDQKDYQYAIVQSFNSGLIPDSSLNSILTDMRLTDAAIQFLAEVKNGNKQPELSYKGISYEPYNMPVVLLLAEYCSKHNLPGNNR